MGIDKLNILLCDSHLEKCEEGLFKTKHPEEEPCLLCIIQEQQKKIDAVIDYIKNQERADEYMVGIVDTDGLKELLK